MGFTGFQIANVTGFDDLGSFLRVLLTLAFFVAGLAMFFNVVIGGIQWINAGGDPKALTSARGRITNSIIGLVIVVAAFSITLIIGSVFGLSIFKFVF